LKRFPARQPIAAPPRTAEHSDHWTLPPSFVESCQTAQSLDNS
jgi:hypothetical protein